MLNPAVLAAASSPAWWNCTQCRTEGRECAATAADIPPDGHAAQPGIAAAQMIHEIIYIFHILGHYAGASEGGSY